MWESIKNLFGKPGQAKTGQAGTTRKPLEPMTPEPDPEEIVVPEVTPAQVQAELAGNAGAEHALPVLLDVREQYEWNQVHMADALHIPMARVPERLGGLPRDRQIVVFCAHGSRSFGVAHYLREQGFDAVNLKGGITQWHIQGGPVEVRRA